MLYTTSLSTTTVMEPQTLTSTETTTETATSTATVTSTSTYAQTQTVTSIENETTITENNGSPGSVYISPPPTLDVLIQTSSFQTLLWDNTPRLTVFIINEGINPGDVAFTYTVVNTASSSQVAQGTNTMYVPTSIGKDLTLNLPPLPNGNYFVTVTATYPLTGATIASGNGNLYISSPFYGQLWFITALAIFIITIIIFMLFSFDTLLKYIKLRN